MRIRTSLASIAIALAACGGSHSNQPDGPACGGCDAPNDNGGGGTTITLTLTNHPTNAAMFSFVVAYQDGSSAWTVAPPPNGDVYTFTVTSAAYGVVWTCVNTTFNTREVNTLYFAVSERTNITEVIPQRCTDHVPPTPVGLSGAVTSPPVQGTVHLAFGLRSADAARGSGGGTAYAMETPPSTHDLIAGDRTALGTNTADFVTPTAAAPAALRGLAVNAMTVQAFDYSTAMQSASAAVTGVPTGNTTRSVVSTDLFSAGGTFLAFVHLPVTAGGTPAVTQGLNAALAASGDLYNQQITVTDTSLGQSATVQNWATAIAAQAYTAPAALGGATSTVTTTTPYPLLKTTWNAYASTIGYAWTAQQPTQAGGCGGTGNCITWATGISPGIAGGSPQELMPDLSGLTGWDPKLQFVTGTVVGGTVVAATSSVGASDFPAFATPPAGTTRAFVTSGWAVTP